MAILLSVAIAVFLSAGPLIGTALATPANVTSPRITTNAWVGQTLTLTKGTYNDNPTIADQWYHCTGSTGTGCTAVTGETGTTYMVGSHTGDVGSYIEVIETATDLSLPATTTPSNVTFPVQAAAPTLATPAGISDTTSGNSTIKQGDALNVTPGTWTEPFDFSSYQWLRCDGSGANCSNISGATSPTYTARRSDVDQTLQVQQTPHYGLTTLPPATALTTAVVPTAPTSSPSDPPTISGDAVQGETLVAKTGTWSNQPDSYTYQWERCDSSCRPTGGIDASYVVTAADVGHTIEVVVTAHVGTTAAGTGSATSAPTGLAQTASTVGLAAAPTAPVTNQSVTLAATVNSRVAAAAPSGLVAFLDHGKAISGCGAVPVSPSGQSVTVFCQASFAAGSAQVTATFTPGAGSAVLGSSSPSETLTVGKDATKTALDASSPLALDTSTTYTATVARSTVAGGAIQPSGSVRFLDGGKPIAGCTARRVVSGGATCAIKYSATGRRSIVAQYLGDANFVGSRSSAKKVNVTAPAARGTITPTMQWTFAYAPSYTRVLSMVINGVPVGATVEMRCHGRGCPFVKRTSVIAKPHCKVKRKGKHKRACPVSGRVDLTGRFHGRHLHPGAQITIQIRRARFVGKYYSFTMRSRKQPRVRIGCLAVNGSRPNMGC